MSAPRNRPIRLYSHQRRHDDTAMSGKTGGPLGAPSRDQRRRLRLPNDRQPKPSAANAAGKLASRVSRRMVAPALCTAAIDRVFAALLLPYDLGNNDCGIISP